MFESFCLTEKEVEALRFGGGQSVLAVKSGDKLAVRWGSIKKLNNQR